MKKMLIIICSVLLCCEIYSQQLYDYKIKNASNANDRDKILNLIRNQLYKDFKIKVVFQVKKLNVCNNYAWFEGEAVNKDGTQININNNDGVMDCCHVEFLSQKVNGVWYKVEYGAFSTDVWWEDIWNRHKAPHKVYGMNDLINLRNSQK